MGIKAAGIAIFLIKVKDPTQYLSDDEKDLMRPVAIIIASYSFLFFILQIYLILFFARMGEKYI